MIDAGFCMVLDAEKQLACCVTIGYLELGLW